MFLSRPQRVMSGWIKNIVRCVGKGGSGANAKGTNHWETETTARI